MPSVNADHRMANARKPPLKLPRWLVEDGVTEVPPGWELDPVSEHWLPPRERSANGLARDGNKQTTADED
jgi:hypothetical protein